MPIRSRTARNKFSNPLSLSSASVSTRATKAKLCHLSQFHFMIHDSWQWKCQWELCIILYPWFTLLHFSAFTETKGIAFSSHC